ncbi:MAG: nitrilase-related carbon-nitrogen hydrolase, partial [Allorhizobium sp.]|uniref:nitrilase-related carbon-nitrogen hydrolase n=1 Tax=Allorhizobium sp. TaxID=633478 RepID=UPI004033A0C9
MSETVKVAALQMRSSTSLERNIADFEALVREAAGKGAVYVQSPEMTGALVRDRAALKALLKPEADDIIAHKAAALAGELGIFVHVGSTAIARPDGKVANRGFVFGPDGSKLATYDKIHMFDVDLDNGESWRESSTYEPGTASTVVNLPFGRLG